MAINDFSIFQFWLLIMIFTTIEYIIYMFFFIFILGCLARTPHGEYAIYASTTKVVSYKILKKIIL